MELLLYCSAALICAFVVQVSIVRVLNPSNHAAVIVAVFGLFSIASVVLFAAFGHGSGDVAAHWAATARLALILASLSLAYIAVYSAIEDDSPSMAMVKMAWKSGAKGCGEPDFQLVMDDRLFLDRRLDAMERDGWIAKRGGAVTLTRLGTFWAKLFRRAQLLLRMDEGG
jgi:hypothetical protein